MHTLKFTKYEIIFYEKLAMKHLCQNFKMPDNPALKSDSEMQKIDLK